MKKYIIATPDNYDDFNYLESVCFGSGVFFEENSIIYNSGSGNELLNIPKLARYLELECRTFSANWSKNGVLAGKIRNQEMIVNATHLVVFNDGKSKRIIHLIDLAKKNKVQIILFTIEYNLVLSIYTSYHKYENINSLEELVMEMGNLINKKNTAHKNQQYEYMAKIRDIERHLSNKAEFYADYSF